MFSYFRHKRMKTSLSVILLLGIWMAFPHAWAQLTDLKAHAVSAASKLVSCPEAKWAVVEQPFWPNHTVLKLASCRWPHRAMVSVDRQWNTRLLTDGVLKLPATQPLAAFNAIAKAESVTVTAINAPDYLRFFINAHLNNRDGLYFGGDALEKKVKQLQPHLDVSALSGEKERVQTALGRLEAVSVAEDPKRRDFTATVYEWSWDWLKNTTDPPTIGRFDITIRRDGTVSLAASWPRL